MKLSITIIGSLALIGGCASVPAVEQVTPARDDHDIVAEARVGFKIIAELTECRHSKVKQFAPLKITASDAAAAAIIECQKIERKFVEAHASIGLTRDAAEKFILGGLQDAKQDLRAYVIDLRAMHEKAPQRPASPSPSPNEM